jgi:hypothetical protein
MTRIRVDTEQLRSQAASLEFQAEIFQRLGADVLRVASSLPSYDGQLSGPARAAGLEFQHQSQNFQRRLGNLHSSISHTASAFEKVNNETVAAFQNTFTDIRDIQKVGFRFGQNTKIPFIVNQTLPDEPSNDTPEEMIFDAARARLFLQEAGIQLAGEWTNEELIAVARVVRQIGAKFKTILSTMGYPNLSIADAFHMVFGDMTFYYGDKPPGSLPLSGYWGRSGAHSITFQPGKVTSRLVGHELGHELAFLLYDSQKGYANLPDHPVSMLIDEGIWDNGEFITGNRNGSYDRNGGLSAQDGNGYRSDDYHDEWQYHPRTMGVDGNSADEDWADIFLNWTYDSFADNPHGAALDQLTDANMEKWLKAALAKNAK